MVGEKGEVNVCGNERVYAMLCFYNDDPDSMRRYRVCNQASSMIAAIWEFDNDLREIWKHGEDEDQLVLVEDVRSMLWDKLNQYEVNLYE